jgi:hypothetical protein
MSIRGEYIGRKGQGVIHLARREYDQFGNQNYLRYSQDSQSNFEMDNDFVQGVNTMSESQGRHNKRSRPNSNVGGVGTAACQELADIIGGMVVTDDPVCVVQRLRNIRASILGRRTQSPLALPFALSFEGKRNGETLNLGETVILQEEINPFLTELRKRGIIVTALHNHWLFDNPRLMYIHWENVGDPFEFARDSINAARDAGLFRR